MKTTNWKDVRRQRTDVTDEDIARERQKIDAELALHKLREKRGVSQTVVAEKLAVSRPRVSKIEKTTGTLNVATMGRYVEALGGRLEVIAVFDDSREKII